MIYLKKKVKHNESKKKLLNLSNRSDSFCIYFIHREIIKAFLPLNTNTYNTCIKKKSKNIIMKK